MRGAQRRNALLIGAVAMAHLMVLALLSLTRPAPLRLASGGPMSVSLAQGLTSSPFPLNRPGSPAKAAPRPQPSDAPATPTPQTASPQTPVDATPPPARPTPKTEQAARTIRPESAPKPPPPATPEPDFATRVAQLASAGPQFDTAALPLHSGAAGASAPTGAPVASTCRLGAALQKTLGEDPAVLGALTHIPRNARTVANAIMLWNGRWIDLQASGGETATLPIRQSIQNGVRSASAACQQETIRGPMLLAIMTRPETTILALGAGEWRWADLLR